MRVFIHEDCEKEKELESCEIEFFYKEKKENVYILNRANSKYLYIIYAVMVEEYDSNKHDNAYVYSLENRKLESAKLLDHNCMECWIGDNNKYGNENLLLINSLYEKKTINDILLDKYIIIIPGGGIIIKLDNYKKLDIYYKKRKI